MSLSVPQIRKIASNLLWTPEGLVRNPLVEVSAEGRILSVTSCQTPDRMAGVEFYAGILMPGLVNSHCHLELSYLRGAIAEGGGFVAFARSMSEAKGRFSAQERLMASEAADARMWSEGIQAVGDISNSEESFATKAHSRIAYRTFGEVFGLCSDATPHMQRLTAHPATSLTPHSLYSVQDAPFRALCAEGTAPLSIHFMESPAEAELYHQRGELWEWYARTGMECDFLHYGSPAQRLIQSVPAERSIMLVHNCCVTQHDIDLIMGHFSAPVWWCLCPRSNRYISRLEPPVELLRRNGLRICLGTDSLASNHSLSLLEEMRMFPGIPLEEVLGWAVEGAHALGMSEELGVVAPGCRSGLVVLSGIDYDRMTLGESAQIRRIV